MDPNETIRRLREITKGLLEPEDWCNERGNFDVAGFDDMGDCLLALAERFTDLDAWLSMGGMFPKSWGRRVMT